ncbi:hypothetical protein DOTSEDRAFT_26254 [Dothistroma septosporum NZE10]|uniref:Uncharacterized protein n=1 Tax=Dothistroma septosporum (strain NZE10 / CBS 128990) TaxID=675120 RepID=N1PKT6_DOTSN|nr:hypothetical protein DOTSEDRAFT_26254 [Dothistroma septosporum NZE10]
MAASRANSCFTDPPAEVRNRIYEFAFISEDKIKVQTLRQFEIEDWFVVMADPMPTLLHLNRQVRQEVLSVHYGNNIFTATFDRTWAVICQDKTKPSKTVSGWAATIGPQQVAVLSKLEINYLGACLTALEWHLSYDSDELLPANKRRSAEHRFGARELLCKGDIIQALELRAVGVTSAVVGVRYDDEEAGNWVELDE